MIKKLVSYLGEYKAASIKTPLFAPVPAEECILSACAPEDMWSMRLQNPEDWLSTA